MNASSILFNYGKVGVALVLTALFATVCSTGLAQEDPLARRDSLDEQNAPFGTNSVPYKNIAVQFHIVRDDDGGQNFQDIPEDQARLQLFVDSCNAILGSLDPHIPSYDCGDIYIRDSRIRLVNKGTRYYNNSDYVCTDTKCQTACEEVYQHFAANFDLQAQAWFPIFVVGFRGERGGQYADCDGQGCPNPNYVLAGRGTSRYVLVRGLYHNRNSIQNVATLLIHELLHSFGLVHLDMDRYKCCLDWVPEETNNIMDYDNYAPFHDRQRALTSCQLGLVHHELENTPMRRFLDNDLCEKQATALVIPEGANVSWTLNEILCQDLIVAGALTVTGDLQVAQDVRFDIRQNGALDLSRANVTYCDGRKDDEPVTSSLTIFPNPCRQFLRVEPSGYRIDHTTIISASGKLMLDSEEVLTEIDVSFLTPGIYFMQLRSEDQIVMKSFVKL